MVNLAKELEQFFTNITFLSGDFVSLFSLFFDNLSTLLGVSGAILGLGSDHPILKEIVYQRVVPAAGIMLFVGNVYYTWQATRMTVKYNHPYTAQPYGLNTAGAFPFVFGIIYGVYFSTTPACTEDTDTCNAFEEEGKRVELAWRVCVTANFLTGLINIFLGFFGQFLMSIFPVAAMLIPLAGIGFTWLALNQIAPNFATPAIGLIPVWLIFTQYYGLGRFHMGRGWYLPEAIPIVAFGIIAGWSYGLNTEVESPVSPGAYIGPDFLEGFSDIGPYIGIVLPFSIAASFGDMMCLVSAQKCGDPYPIRETMIVDGIGTLIGAILGCPFGTVVYIGIPVHKRVGARTGYSFMNGFVYLILCLSGVIPVVLSLIPAIAIGPIIFIFGLMICEDCTKHIAQRHHFTIFFGLFFGVCDYIYTNFQPGGNFYGQETMSRGSALLAMLWAAMAVYACDRRWLKAAMFAVITAGFAGVGIIHQPESFENFLTGFQLGGKRGDDEDRSRRNTSPFQFMIGYLTIAVSCLLYYYLQKTFPKKTAEGEEGYDEDHGYLPPVEDEHVDNIFATWWDPVLNKENEPTTQTVKKVDEDSDEGEKAIAMEEEA